MMSRARAARSGAGIAEICARDLRSISVSMVPPARIVQAILCLADDRNKSQAG